MSTDTYVEDCWMPAAVGTASQVDATTDRPCTCVHPRPRRRQRVQSAALGDLACPHDRGAIHTPMVRALRHGHLTREHLHERLILLDRRQPPPPAASATLQGLRGISHLTLLSQRHAPTPMLRNQTSQTGHDPRITT